MCTAYSNLVLNILERRIYMDCKINVKKLREMTGMNRREFCEYFEIPYSTVTDWEREHRHAPNYVLRLLEYKIQMENPVKKK